ncbi:MAG: ABC transporter ATP-binding protein [Pirellula sp.]|nr:ABC transporter ATP-binding protein [Pirellula sp.]
MSEQPIIEIGNLVKRYGDQTVLNKLSLSVRTGELLVVLGASGSGKSTLLRLIAGLELANEGQLKVAGVEQSQVPPHKRDIAVVFQSGNGYSHLSVHENLILAAKANNMADRSYSAGIDHWISKLELQPLLKKKIPQLSGGQAQRVAIARAFLSGKSIVLLDEPLSNLDQSSRAEVRGIVARVHAETNRTLIYVTHDSDEALFLASRIAVLASGQIHQLGIPRELYEAPETTEVALMLGQPAMDLVHAPTDWMKGIKGTGVNSTQPNRGIRSNDWRIDRIELHGEDCRSLPTDPISPTEFGLFFSETTIELVGAIAKVRWLGDRWLIDVQIARERLHLSCPAPSNEILESRLRHAELINNAHGAILGTVYACVPTSSTKSFR